MKSTFAHISFRIDRQGMRLLRSIRYRSLVAAASFLLAVACGRGPGTPIPESDLEITDRVEDWRLTTISLRNVTDTVTYQMTQGHETVLLADSSRLTSGRAKVRVTDPGGRTVFYQGLGSPGSYFGGNGAPGTWTVTVTLTKAKGNLDLRLAPGPELVPLPAPVLDGSVSVERALTLRRSIRHYAEQAVTLGHLGQMLWAGQGMTEVMDEPPSWFGDHWWTGGFRATPSPGALYPIELYVSAVDVEGLEPGVYGYIPVKHALWRVVEESRQEALFEASLRQNPIRDAPATVVIAAVVERIRDKYPNWTDRFVPVEAGAAAENMFLQVQGIGLATLYMGGFDFGAAAEAVGLPDGHDVFGLMPLGWPAEDWREQRANLPG